MAFDRLASYGNYGSTITLSAPGGDIPPGPDDYYPYLCVGAFSPDAVPGKFYASATGTSFKFQLPASGVILEEVEREFVRQALELTGENQTRAARLLGLTRDELRYRAKKFGFGHKAEEDLD